MFECTKAYRNDETFRCIVRKIFGLAFLPEFEIFRGYSMIKNELISLNITNINGFFDYIERTYIGRYNDKLFIEPLYKHNFWNINETIVFNIPRSINSLESWHKSIKKKWGFIILILLIGLKLYYLRRNYIVLIIKAKSGQYETLRIDMDKEHRLQMIVREYENFGLEDFFLNLLKIYKWKMD